MSALVVRSHQAIERALLAERMARLLPVQLVRPVPVEPEVLLTQRQTSYSAQSFVDASLCRSRTITSPLPAKAAGITAIATEDLSYWRQKRNPRPATSSALTSQQFQVDQIAIGRYWSTR